MCVIDQPNLTPFYKRSDFLLSDVSKVRSGRVKVSTPSEEMVSQCQLDYILSLKQKGDTLNTKILSCVTRIICDEKIVLH